MSEKVASTTTSRSVILTKDGKPFGTENAANLAMHQKGLSFDTHSITAIDGGFAITPKAGVVDEAQLASATEKSEPGKIKYYQVRFHSKSNPNDDDCVKLGANGLMLVIKRDTPVVLSETFLEVARHAKYTKWDFKPGSDRKTDAHVSRFPYDTLREATEREFMQLLGKEVKGV